MSSILVIDDNPVDRLVLKKALTAMGHEVMECETGEAGVARVAADEVELVLLDFMMPGMNGIEALKKIKQTRPRIPVVLVTGLEEAEGAIEAMRHGAYDYLTKPADPGALQKIAAQALEASERMRVQVEIEDISGTGSKKERIIGRSPAMWELYKKIGQVAGTDATVLITGESGTGKELVARAVYQHSARSDHDFLAVNCAAMPRDLLESELFGHEKGAFTGAAMRHIGKFERLTGGTFFLDEIGDMHISTQAKILRVLQEKTFERVGGTEVLHSDVRILAATNKDLRKEVDQGHFREDLYYRLNVVNIHLPPLRERREDIPELCDYLLHQIGNEIGKPSVFLAPESFQVLVSYDWPGNVRELRNVLARAAVASPSSVILPDHFDLVDWASPASVSEFCPFQRSDLDRMDEKIYESVIGEVERRLFQYVLERTGGNQVMACRILGVSRNMLRERVQRFGLDEPKAR